jgi:hypothetical protein
MAMALPTSASISLRVIIVPPLSFVLVIA